MKLVDNTTEFTVRPGTTVEDLWKRYAQHIFIGVAASPDEIRRSRQDFFSGAYAFLTALQMLAQSPHIDKEAPNWIVDRRQEMEKCFEEWINLEQRPA